MIDDILDIAGKNFVDNLRSQFENNDLNNTKKASDSLSYNVNGDILEIQGLLRVIVLVTGRKPGEFPPVNDIEKWVNSKLGITGKEGKSVAFLIARKIAKFGTNIFTGKAKGLNLELALVEAKKKVHKEISKEVTLNISNIINEAYK